MRSLFIERLAQSVSGQIILVNILRGLDDNAIDPKYIEQFLDTALRKVDDLAPHARADEREFLNMVYEAAWAREAALLLRGRDSAIADERNFVILKSLASLKRLLADAELIDETLAGLLRRAGNVYDETAAGYCEDLAEYINKLPEEAPIYLSPLIPGGDGERCIAWYSRAADCPEFGGCPDNTIATNARDWLGLGDIHADMPLFLFEPKQPLGNWKPRRPLAFDAIEQRWFKHRLDEGCPDDAWGRATDLARLREPPVEKLDGGPESVGNTLRISGNFHCRYVGRPQYSVRVPDERYVELLARPNDLAHVVSALCDKFAKPPATSAKS
jgi:hypothetical protein